MCAIDFTASNGKPTTANSLHYINPYAPNDYQKAIVSVGNILLEYDSDGAICATGFGAKIPPEYKTSFCFNLSLSNQQYAMAIPGLMNYYSNAIANVKLYGLQWFYEIFYLCVCFFNFLFYYSKVQQIWRQRLWQPFKSNERRQASTWWC